MDLKDLAATGYDDGVDVANLPEERGGSQPPPTPGVYRWKLPKTLGAANFAPTGKADGPKDRVQVRFDQHAPLICVGAPAGSDFLGNPFTTSISNIPRKRGFKDDAPVASDWDYLNKALKVITRPANAKAYAEQLLKDAATEAEFTADAEWSWGCNDQRDAFFADGEGGSQPAPDSNSPGNNVKGCGAKYYQARPGQAPKAADVAGGKAGSIAKAVQVEGQPAIYPLVIQCACGASVRAFANLTRIRE